MTASITCSGRSRSTRRRQRRCVSFTTTWGCAWSWPRNTQPHETRWPALRKAGIDDLFSVVLLSYPLGVRKPDPVFYRLVLAAAGAPPEQVLFIGDDLQADVIAPLAHGMRAVLVRPQGLRQGETLPDGAMLIEHVRELPALWETI